jgi:hypothetical protein
MTVKELIEALGDYPEELEVLMVTEGNMYSEIESVKAAKPLGVLGIPNVLCVTLRE